MEDYHVDRPDVEAQQCVKLTGTNSSIGLIALISNTHPLSSESNGSDLSGKTFERARVLLASIVLGRPGGFSGGPVPDPISNSAVKLPSADGTKPQGLEE